MVGASPAANATVRIGLDLDGLLDEQPTFFAFLTAALRGGGHFVAVLTYRDPESKAGTERQLAGWGIAFDELRFARSARRRACSAANLLLRYSGRCVLRASHHDANLRRCVRPERATFKSGSPVKTTSTEAGADG
jgi:hypothetical protein